jgi:uncharacterized Fe-S cluster protein YjdI
MAHANAGIRSTRYGQFALRGQRGDKVVQIGQGNCMKSNPSLFEVLQKRRDVEPVVLKGFLFEVANPPRMRPTNLSSREASPVSRRGPACRVRAVHPPMYVEMPL